MSFAMLPKKGDSQTPAKPQSAPSKAPPKPKAPAQPGMMEKPEEKKKPGPSSAPQRPWSIGQLGMDQPAPKILQRKADSETLPIPGAVPDTLRSSGEPLDPETRALMEKRFGHDFRGVRIHNDTQAARSAKAVHAQAYTVGQDIAFAEGKYRPHTAEGQKLIAHELAHTIQQRGLQRSADGLTGLSHAEDRRFESEADRAAERVTGNHPTPSSALPSLTRAGRPQLSRTASGKPKVKLPSGVEADESGDPEEGAYLVDELKVPGEKGKINFFLYEKAAGKPDPYGLKTNRQVSGGKVANSDQEPRDDTSMLRRKWLSQLNLKNNEDADKIWREAGGGKEFPYLRKSPDKKMSKVDDPCQVDHVVELQLGGRNNPENLQVLDKDDNEKSGRVLKDWTIKKAQSIADKWTDGQKAKYKKITVRYKKATLVNPKKAGDGLRISEKMKKEALEDAPAKSEAGDYYIRAVPDSTDADDAQAGQSSRTKRAVVKKPAGLKDVDLKGTPANGLVKYLSLDTLHFNTKGDTIEATPTGKFANVVTFNNKKTIILSVGPQPGGVLSLNDTKNPLVRKTKGGAKVPFKMSYFSPGTIDEMDINPDGEWDWTGTLHPDAGKLLPKSLTLRQKGETLSVEKGVNPKEIQSPIPGMVITGGGMKLQILPDLAASGNLTFIVGPEAKPLADGKIDVGADDQGLTAKGELAARIPGVDKASAEVTYKDGEWKGHLGVESSQIKLPLVQKGQLALDIDKQGLHPSGDVTLGLPQNMGEVTVGFLKEGEKYVFKGDGSLLLPIPGMKEHPVKVGAKYDGDKFTAAAYGVGFSWKGLSGELTEIVYTSHKGEEGKTHGSGKLTIKNHGITGEVEVKFNEAGKFSGKGKVGYPFKIGDTEIDASAGVVVDEQQKIKVDGLMEVPKPIELFRRFGSNQKLFYVNQTIPLPGVSIGPVGIVAVVEGGVSIHYYFGPGQLKEVKITAELYPLEENPELTATFHCVLDIPSGAGIDGTVGGGIGVKAGLGSVQGTLTVTAGLNLEGKVGGPLDAKYAQKILSVKAKPGLDASLNLGLSLDAHARAQAGIGRFSIGVEKDWNLGHRDVRLGQFSMFAPIEWSSDGKFTPPSLDQIEWKMPSVDFHNVLDQLMSGSGTEKNS